MTESYRFESERREAASRFITTYKEHITSEPLTREEIYAAFGGLVMSEFDYDSELAQKFLETDRSNFVEYEAALQEVEDTDVRLRTSGALYNVAAHCAVAGHS